MTDTKSSPNLGRLTEDHELYQQTIAIMAGIKEVRAALEVEAREIQNSNPGVMFPAGYGERLALVEALSEGHQLMAVDIRRAARSSGLSFPEGVL